MRSRGIDHARAVIGDQRNRLTRGIIWQAQDGDISRVQRFGAGFGVLALGIAQRNQAELVAPGQPVGDFKARGARRAVDEYLCGHGSSAASGR